MAVSVTDKLKVVPASGNLPLQISLRQSLLTNVPPEQAQVVYEIEPPAGDVVFRSTGTTMLTKARTVGQQSTQFADDDFLDGSLTNSILRIKQTLTDQSGSLLISRCTVNLKGAAGATRPHPRQ